jgi:hypothetical protein
MNKSFVTFFFISILFPLISFSQEDADTVNAVVEKKENYFDQYLSEIESKKANEGQIIIYQDRRIKNLMNKQIRIDEKNPGFEGYRIQIFFDSGSQARSKANQIKSDFLTMYSDIGAYMTYEQPFFKIRVGDFRSMLEAQGFKNIISAYFPSAFIVSDKINSGY